jgi:hypothetical protein
MELETPAEETLEDDPVGKRVDPLLLAVGDSTK